MMQKVRKNGQLLKTKNTHMMFSEDYKQRNWLTDEMLPFEQLKFWQWL